MILSNETLWEETNNKLEKGEKNNLFLGNNYITKRKGRAFIRPEKQWKQNGMYSFTCKPHFCAC